MSEIMTTIITSAIVAVVTAIVTSASSFLFGKLSSTSKEKFLLQQKRFECLYSPLIKWTRIQFSQSGAFDFVGLPNATKNQMTQFLSDNFDYASPKLKSWIEHFFHIIAAYRQESSLELDEEINRMFREILEISRAEYNKLCRKLYYKRTWSNAKFVKYYKELPKE